MNNNDWTSSTVTSADGTTIAYETLGTGAGLIVVGGVLSTARNYMDLGRELAGSFTVHLMERRGRGASGPQGPGYSIEKECEDLLAVQSGDRRRPRVRSQLRRARGAPDRTARSRVPAGRGLRTGGRARRRTSTGLA